MVPSIPVRPSPGAGPARRALVAAVGALAGLSTTLGLAVIGAAPALAASGSGTASGTTVVLGHPVSFPPPCAIVTGPNGTPGLTFTESGTGSYTATSGVTTATYTGPVNLALSTTSAPAYSGPTGSHGYDPTCNNPPGTPFDVTATVTGTSGSGSVSCDYSGTLSRVNPTSGNGTDRATVILAGSCTVTEGSATVASSPTDEVNDISYVGGSCIGGPPPITCHVTDSFTATNAPVALTITTASPLPGASQGTPYTQTITADGGIAPYTFSLASGSTLPVGLSLSSAGVLSGTPKSSGPSTFTVDVADSATPAHTVTKSFTLAVNAAPALAVTTASPLPPGIQGTPYTQTITATGGVAPYTFSLAPGSALPAGLSLSSAGVLSGTPSGSGTSTFTVDAADSATPADTASKALSLTVSPPSPTVSITTASPLPDATVGIPYTQSILASGGTRPYTFSVTKGSTLPAGLALSSAGVLSGTPSAAGTSSFTVSVRDAARPASVATETLTITVRVTTLLVSNGSGPGGAGSVSGYADPPTGCGGTPVVCDPSPFPFISGPATNLLAAEGLAQDPAGDLYVASFSPSGRPAVDEYPPGATGNTAPIAVLSGPATGLGFSQGMAIDPSGTHLYVVNQTSVITEYDLPFTSCAGSPPTCNDAPVATLSGPSTQLKSPFGISFDSSGNLWVANLNDAVTEYAPLAPGADNTPPVATLAGPATGLHAPDYVLVRGATLFVSNFGAGPQNSITEYALPLTGCTGTPPTCNEAPSVTLSGPASGLDNPSGFVFDASGNLFVVNQAGGSSPPSSVTEYSPSQYASSGDPTPIATIAGPATDLSGPEFIVIAAAPPQAATTLSATAAIRPGKRPFVLTATLMAGGHPVGGQTVVFSAGATVLCRSTTDAAGVATCNARTATGVRAVATHHGYTASFAGAPGYQASQAHGALAASGPSRTAGGGGTGAPGGSGAGRPTSWNRHGGWS